MDAALKESYQQGFDEGLYDGVQAVIKTMLAHGCHPHFLAKITNLPVSHIQTFNELHIKEQKAHE